MKYAFLIGCLALSSMAFGAEPKADAKAAVLAAEQKWVEAVLHRNAAVLEKLMASDILYTHSSAKTQTRAEFIQAATSGSTTYTAIDFSDVVVRQYGRTVIVNHKATFKSAHGESHLYISEVWSEQNGQWQMVSRQATKLP